MDIKEFIQAFTSILEVTPSEKLNAETRIRDLEEWSSIFALGIVALIDSEYNVRIKGDDIKNSQTIGDLFKLVESCLRK